MPEGRSIYSMSKSIAKNSFFNVIYNGVNILFPLIATMIVARVLESDGVGKVSYAQNIASYFSTAAALGIPSYGIREVAKVRSNSLEVNKLFTELFLINLTLTIISTIGYFVLIQFAFQSDFLLYLACGLVIFFNIVNIDWVYQGTEDYWFIMCRNLLVKIIFLILLVVCVRSKEDYVVYALINSIAVCGNYIFGMARHQKYVHFDFFDLHFKKHCKPLFYLTASIFMSSIYSKVDVTMLGIMTTDEHVGLYTYAHKVILLITTAGTAITSVFLPRLSACYKRDMEQFYSIIGKGIKLLSFVIFPMTIGILAVAHRVTIVFFGNPFTDAAMTMRIFTPIILISSFGNLLCYQLILCTGNEKRRLPAYFAAALLNVIFNAILIPIMAENGAAIASVISEFVVNGVQLVYIRKILDIPLEGKYILQAFLSAAIMGICVYAVDSFMNCSDLLSLLVDMLVGITIYLGINILMKSESIKEIYMWVKERRT